MGPIGAICGSRLDLYQEVKEEYFDRLNKKLLMEQEKQKALLNYNKIMIERNLRHRIL